MKRIGFFSAIVALLLLCACVPTPETDYVVNKGDNIVEQKLSATNEPETGDKPETALPFPTHWTEEPFVVGNRVTVAIDAEIVQKSDAVYPVYRTRERKFTDEDAIELATALLPNPVSTHDAQMTKEDWTREFRMWLDEVEAYRDWEAAGKPNDGVDRDESGYSQEFVDSESAWYMEQIRKAPDSPTETTVSDYRGIRLNDRKAYVLADGRTAYVGALDWSICIGLDSASQPYVFDEGQYAQESRFGDKEPNVAAWKEPVMQLRDAEAMLSDVLEKAGLTDFTVRLAQKANLYREVGSKPVSVATGWSFSLVRDYGGYPTSKVLFEPAQNLEYSANDGFQANKPIMEETLTVMIGPNGLLYFEYNEPKEVIGVENANVELLSWEETKMRLKNALTLTAPIAYLEREDCVALLRVYKAMLTTYTVRARNSDACYEMPCWVLFYDADFRSRGSESFYDDIYTEEFWNRIRNDTALSHNALIVNAVDGSIVYTDYGN